MANRLAGILAVIAFAMCLLVGAFEADNPFTTCVYRSLIAMFWTYVVGYLVGIAAERMVAEHVVGLEKKAEAVAKESATEGR